MGQKQVLMPMTLSLWARAAAVALLTFTLGLTALARPIDPAQLDARIKDLMAQDGMVGLSLAVIESGEITFARGYGLTRIGGDPVTEHTVFRWASLSKSVAATHIALLAERGQLSLSDPVAAFNTSLRLPGGSERTATLEHLLSHRLGLVPNAYDTTLEDLKPPATIRRSLGKLTAICPVGDCHSYQNVAFDAVTEIIESATGKAYADAVSAALFRPLDMASASFGRYALQSAPSWAAPHRRNRATQKLERLTVNDAYYNVPAAGGINGSILDLAKFAQAQMGRRPDFFSEASLQTLHTPRVKTPKEQATYDRHFDAHLKDARYGLGWRVYTYADTGKTVVGHRGGVAGYRSLILFDPANQNGVVALWNSEWGRPTGLQFEVMDRLLDLPARDVLKLDKPS